MARFYCTYITPVEQGCVTGPGHLLSVRPPAQTSILVLVTTLSVKADEAEGETGQVNLAELRVQIR